MADDNSYYLVQVYIPNSCLHDDLISELRTQWSATFGGTTRVFAGGTYKNEPEEPVTVFSVYISRTFNKAQVIGYFKDRRIELANRFPGQQEFLITFSEPYYFL